MKPHFAPTLLPSILLLLLGPLNYALSYYDPGAQRWLNRDPVEEVAEYNLYCHVGNAPIDRVDPLGLYFGGGPPPGYHGPQYPQGFAICQRDLQKDSSCDCAAMIGNALGGEHTYLQHVGAGGDKWGYGWGGAKTKPGPEQHFNPNSCKKCSKTADLIKHGPGAGKSGGQASDAEIKDCIKNVPPRKPYSKLGYNCNSWAKDAAKECGLNCD